MNKIYVLRYRSYEFDDSCPSGYCPIFISLDKEKVVKFFNEQKKKVINNFNRIIKDNNISKNSEDYRILENNDKALCLYQGNWSYRYIFEEYELDKAINQEWVYM